MLSPSEKLMSAIFGERNNGFVDYPLLVGGTDSVLLAELSRQNGRYSDLSPREQRVLLLRFGFDTGKARTLEEVGKEFNVTRDRIRQIEAKALRKLRHPYHSRNLRAILYQPTREDQRAAAMRGRLCDELVKVYPEAVAYALVMGIKRPYVKRALRDLTRGNIAEQVRHSCGLTMRFCRSCGTITLPNWDFCSKECEKAYKVVTLVCDECGQSFPRRAREVVYRLGKAGYQHYFCSKQCIGKYAGKHFGFGAHPENAIGGKRKWDWDLVWQKHLETGYSASKLSRLLGIPQATIYVILKAKRQGLVTTAF